MSLPAYFVSRSAGWPGLTAPNGATLRYAAGLDLGKKHDHTAVAIVERAERVLPQRNPATWEFLRETTHTVRYLERLPLGVDYTDVVAHVAALLRSPHLAPSCDLVVDATGVGEPVLELIEAERLRCDVLPVVITSGFRESRVEHLVGVPKRNLVLGLELMFERGELRISEDLPECDLLLRELRGVEVRQGPTGYEAFGNWRHGEHDDLVLAVALACWHIRKPQRPLFGSERLI